MPVLVTGVPAELIKQAQSNAGKNFPWGGDYSGAKSVSCEPGLADGNKGVFQLSHLRPIRPSVRRRADGEILPRGRHWSGSKFLRSPIVCEFSAEGVLRSRPRSSRSARKRRHESAIRGRRQSGSHAVQESRTMVWPDGGRRLADQHLAHHRRLLLRGNVGPRLRFRPEQSVPFVQWARSRSAPYRSSNDRERDGRSAMLLARRPMP